MIYDPSTMMTPTTACLPKPSSTVPSSLDDTTDLISAYYRTTTNSSSFDTFGRERQDSVGSASSDKIYSFVAIPGMNQKKRPRRRYDEIERLYHCTFSGCKKSYGTLNHLNSHILMQNHGPKRHPAEFKEMRKEWRRQKKQREAQKKEVNQQIQQQQQQQEKEQVQQQALLQPSTLMASFQPGALTGSYSLQPMTLSGFY
ncbi:uncharacterized protein BX664DRAFT_334754 [Halteromyces radiatus]|uniref:uncharacterized protein n=1 Tax=Halteromyces radiatus TaxID=101107 RepID=UPI00222088F2|nr:uncharacterized protein BX664DRAFT_334754 [Halteromyces radiatus]KAI8086035.1 hypothetical protein BX664DRAFT_334754 [Halteromyces radiatus]